MQRLANIKFLSSKSEVNTFLHLKTRVCFKYTFILFGIRLLFVGKSSSASKLEAVSSMGKVCIYLERANVWSSVWILTHVHIIQSLARKALDTR